MEHHGIFRDKAFYTEMQEENKVFYTETQEEIKALGASTWKREATQ